MLAIREHVSCLRHFWLTPPCFRSLVFDARLACPGPCYRYDYKAYRPKILVREADRDDDRASNMGHSRVSGCQRLQIPNEIPSIVLVNSSSPLPSFQQAFVGSNLGNLCGALFWATSCRLKSRRWPLRSPCTASRARGSLSAGGLHDDSLPPSEIKKKARRESAQGLMKKSQDCKLSFYYGFHGISYDLDCWGPTIHAANVKVVDCLLKWKL